MLPLLICFFLICIYFNDALCSATKSLSFSLLLSLSPPLFRPSDGIPLEFDVNRKWTQIYIIIKVILYWFSCRFGFVSYKFGFVSEWKLSVLFGECAYARNLVGFGPFFFFFVWADSLLLPTQDWFSFLLMKRFAFSVELSTHTHNWCAVLKTETNYFLHFK